MRLVHAVLLPGIVVFVAEMNLLQAHTLRGDEADVSARGFRDTDSETPLDEESRMDFSRLEPLGKWGSTYDSRIALANNAYHNHWEDKAELFEIIEKELVKHFESLWMMWRDGTSHTSFRSFENSPGGTEMKILVDQINGLHGDNIFGVRKIAKKSELLKH